MYRHNIKYGNDIDRLSECIVDMRDILFYPEEEAQGTAFPPPSAVP